MSLRGAILHEAGWAGNQPRRCWLQPEISQSRPAMVTHGSWTGHQHGSTMMEKSHGLSREVHEWSTRMLLKHNLDQGLTKTGAVETVDGKPEDDPLLDRVRGGWIVTWLLARRALLTTISGSEQAKGIIKAWLQEFPKLGAQRLFGFRHLQVRQHRPHPTPQVVPRFHRATTT